MGSSPCSLLVASQCRTMNPGLELQQANSPVGTGGCRGASPPMGYTHWLGHPISCRLAPPRPRFPGSNRAANPQSCELCPRPPACKHGSKAETEGDQGGDSPLWHPAASHYQSLELKRFPAGPQDITALPSEQVWRCFEGYKASYKALLAGGVQAVLPYLWVHRGCSPPGEEGGSVAPTAGPSPAFAQRCEHDQERNNE